MMWFFDLPVWVVEIVCLSVAAAIGIGLHLLVQRLVPFSRLVKHNDVAGFLFSMIGVIYAVVLGFVVIVVWEKYDTALANAQAEESAVSDLYRIAAGFPDATKIKIRGEIKGLARIMVDQEWPAMRQARNSQAAYLAGEDIAYTIESVQPRGAAQTNLHAAALSILQHYLDARRERLAETEGAVLPILWVTLILGGIATLGFTYFFGTENQRMQLTMTGVIAALIATMFVLIGEFDYPFAGSVSIEPAMWTNFIQNVLPAVR
jgi:hypothetical protein